MVRMDRKVFEAVAERSGGICENEECGRYGNLEKHHAFGASNRKQMEMKETVFDLCHDCHERVDRDYAFNLKWKHRAIDNLLAIGWTKDKIMARVGKWHGG